MNTGAKRKPIKSRTASAARDGEDSDFRSLLRSAVYALCIALACAMILLIVLSIIAYSNPDPDVLISPFSYSALFASALIGGIACAKINGRSGLLSGAMSGLLLLIVLFAASLFTGSDDSDMSFGITLAFYAGVILASVIGGLLGSRKPKRRHRRITPK